MNYRPFARISCVFAGFVASHGLFAQPPKPPVTPPKATTPVSPPSSPPKSTPGAKPASDFKTATELLDALETADKQIRTIAADLSFTTVAGEIEGGERQIRTGKVWFRNRAAEGAKDVPANAAASVFFEWLFLPNAGNKRVAENKTYVVDGPVMIEKITAEKLVNRIKFAAGEKRQDPLKLGEGPFPLPFGQKRDEVLNRFEAKLAPALDTVPDGVALRQRLEKTYQLVLTPKPTAGVSSNVKEVRVWYQKSDLLPTLARIIRPDGGFDEFFLIGMQVNKALPANVFDTRVPEGWRVQDKEKP